MNKVEQLIPDPVKNVVEIVVHVKDELEQERQKEGVSALENINGILKVEFCPLRSHLVLAKYNKDIFSSQDVLNNISSLKLEAKLIGPI